MDAAPIVFAPLWGLGWCVQRVCVQAPSGRQRLNVLAALHAMPHERMTVEPRTSMPAATVRALVRLMAGTSQGRPITILPDKARAQRCVLVQAVVHAVGMALRFVPASAPHWHRLARLWRFVKKQCRSSRYDPHRAAFQHAILTCIQRAPMPDPEELPRLLT